MIEYIVIAAALILATFTFRYSKSMEVMRMRMSDTSNQLHQPLP